MRFILCALGERDVETGSGDMLASAVNAAKSSDGWTPLTHAAHRGNEAIAMVRHPPRVRIALADSEIVFVGESLLGT